MPVFTFLEEYSFDVKTVVPFTAYAERQKSRERLQVAHRQAQRNAGTYPGGNAASFDPSQGR